MCEEDIFEGLLQEILYCAASGHTDKWEETDWREWLRPQVEVIYQKAEKLDSLLTLFYDQPDQVIQWTPDKRYYSWAFPSRTRACKLLEEILEILLDESIVTHETRSKEDEE